MFDSIREFLRDPINALLAGSILGGILGWIITKTFDRFPTLIGSLFRPIKRRFVKGYVKEFNADVTAMKRGVFVYSYLNVAFMLVLGWVIGPITMLLAVIVITGPAERLTHLSSSPLAMFGIFYWLFMLFG